VLGLEADMERILTDETASPWPNDPVLYEPDCFRIVDLSSLTFGTVRPGKRENGTAILRNGAKVGSLRITMPASSKREKRSGKE
jgi:hypothetical protein